MQTLVNYEIVIIPETEKVIVTHNLDDKDKSVYFACQDEIFSSKKQGKNLLVYFKAKDEEVPVALYEDFSFAKIKLSEQIEIAEIDKTGEIVVAVVVFIGAASVTH